MSTVVVRALAGREPTNRILCVSPYRDLFDGSPYIGAVVDPTGDDIFPMAFQDRNVINLNDTLDYQPHRRERPVHLIDLLCERAGVENDGRGPECFLRPAELRWAEAKVESLSSVRRPATILIATRTSTPNKEWRLDHWRRVVQWYGDAVSWLHVGLPNSERVGGVEYLDVSARETIALAGAVSGVIALDTFLLHAAACVRRLRGGVITLLGSSKPGCVSYPSFHDLYLEHYECQPCGRPYGKGDFQRLPNGELARWPNGKPVKWICDNVACMDLITPEMVVEAIDQFILERGAT